MVLLPVEPEDEQGNEDDPAAHTEQPREQSGRGPDHCQFNRSRARHAGHTRPVGNDATEQALATLSADPDRTAVLLDVDGTLAPIVDRPADATVPVPVRMTLIELGRRCGLVACISGRQADEARRIVGAGGITYVGGHGSELLRPGASEPLVDAALAPWAERVHGVAVDASRELAQVGVRREDKGAVTALHYRGVVDEEAARLALEAVAAQAEADGLAVHWGRKVLELRPPVPFDKGQAVAELLAADRFDAALYAGDDNTDLDAFAALDASIDSGAIEHAVKIAVVSTEMPAGLTETADLTVDGTTGAAAFLFDLLERIRG